MTLTRILILLLLLQVSGVRLQAEVLGETQSAVESGNPEPIVETTTALQVDHITLLPETGSGLLETTPPNISSSQTTDASNTTVPVVLQGPQRRVTEKLETPPQSTYFDQNSTQSMSLESNISEAGQNSSRGDVEFCRLELRKLIDIRGLIYKQIKIKAAQEMALDETFKHKSRRAFNNFTLEVRDELEDILETVKDPYPALLWEAWMRYKLEEVILLNYLMLYSTKLSHFFPFYVSASIKKDQEETTTTVLQKCFNSEFKGVQEILDLYKPFFDKMVPSAGSFKSSDDRFEAKTTFVETNETSEQWVNYSGTQAGDRLFSNNGTNGVSAGKLRRRPRVDRLKLPLTAENAVQGAGGSSLDLQWQFRNKSSANNEIRLALGTGFSNFSDTGTSWAHSNANLNQSLIERSGSEKQVNFPGTRGETREAHRGATQHGNLDTNHTSEQRITFSGGAIKENHGPERAGSASLHSERRATFHQQHGYNVQRPSEQRITFSGEGSATRAGSPDSTSNNSPSKQRAVSSHQHRYNGNSGATEQRVTFTERESKTGSGSQSNVNNLPSAQRVSFTDLESRKETFPPAEIGFTSGINVNNNRPLEQRVTFTDRKFQRESFGSDQNRPLDSRTEITQIEPPGPRTTFREGFNNPNYALSEQQFTFSDRGDRGPIDMSRNQNLQYGPSDQRVIFLENDAKGFRYPGDGNQENELTRTSINVPEQRARFPERHLNVADRRGIRYESSQQQNIPWARENFYEGYAPELRARTPTRETLRSELELRSRYPPNQRIGLSSPESIGKRIVYYPYYYEERYPTRRVRYEILGQRPVFSAQKTIGPIFRATSKYDTPDEYGNSHLVQRVKLPTDQFFRTHIESYRSGSDENYGILELRSENPMPEVIKAKVKLSQFAPESSETRSKLVSSSSEILKAKINQGVPKYHGRETIDQLQGMIKTNENRLRQFPEGIVSSDVNQMRLQKIGEHDRRPLRVKIFRQDEGFK